MTRTFAVSMPSGPKGTVTISSTLAPTPGPSYIGDMIPMRQGKKRRREKHHRYSPDFQGPTREHKRKHKRKSLDIENPNQQEAPRIKIKIKPIPMPVGEGSMSGGPQMFIATSSTETTVITPPTHIARPRTSRLSSGSKKPKEPESMTKCDVCGEPGSNQNLVRYLSVLLDPRERDKFPESGRDDSNNTGAGESKPTHVPSLRFPRGKNLQPREIKQGCDECMKCFHFTCLDPPVKKSPKMRGYSWHCADCDPTRRGARLLWTCSCAARDREKRHKSTPDLLQRVVDLWTSDKKEQLLSSVRNRL
uniref:Zinc finger PHD-type domain-containing protein n=1 Tax=Timema tahoe TaxID=61484 RepID=A0A7R9IQ93_9NEOP|nr:unnamed protein product [Timema tahoe]